MYVCIYIYIYIHVHVYIYIYIYTHLHPYAKAPLVRPPRGADRGPRHDPALQLPGLITEIASSRTNKKNLIITK